MLVQESKSAQNEMKHEALYCHRPELWYLAKRDAGSARGMDQMNARQTFQMWWSGHATCCCPEVYKAAATWQAAFLCNETIIHHDLLSMPAALSKQLLLA